MRASVQENTVDLRIDSSHHYAVDFLSHINNSRLASEPSDSMTKIHIGVIRPQVVVCPSRIYIWIIPLWTKEEWSLKLPKVTLDALHGVLENAKRSAFNTTLTSVCITAFPTPVPSTRLS